MEQDYSKSALLRFLDFVAEKGLLTKQNAQNWRVATGKILDDLGPTEQNDVRKIDVETAFKRFANKTAGKFNPNTLGEYRRRATLALQNFVEYVDDPEVYKPRGNIPTRKSDRMPSASKVTGDAERSKVTRQKLDDVAAGSGLAMPYPLRADFLAQVVIPRDMTVEEAKRFSAFIQTLARDFQPLG